MLLLALLGAGDAAALGLGEITVLSRLGERLRAEVPLVESSSENRAAADCFRLASIAEADAELPALARGKITLERTGGRARLLITSDRAIQEPALQLSVRVGCGAELVRSYALLIDPAPGDAAVLPPGTPLSFREQSAPANAASPGRNAWQPAAGESARSLAQSLFPRQQAAQRRFLRDIQAANPDINLGPQGDASLPAGAALRLPANSRPLDDVPTVTAKPARQQTSPLPPRRESAAVPPRPRGQGRLADRLVISADADEASGGAPGLPLRLSTDLSGRVSANAGENSRAVFRMEYKLLTALYDQANQQLTLAEQVRNLESTLTQMQTATETATRGADQVLATPSPDAPPVAVVPPQAPAGAAPAGKPTATTPSPAASDDWWLVIGALLALVGVLVWVLRRRAARRLDLSSDAGDEFAVLQSGGAENLMRGSDAPSPAKAPVAEESVGDGLTVLAPATEPGLGEHTLSGHSQGSTVVTENYEFNPVMELAEIMLSFGRVKGAAQALEEYIAHNPKEALQPWLKLLEIYRQADMRSEYETFSEKLRQHFNVAPADWDTAGELSKPPIEPVDERSVIIDDLLPRLPAIGQLPHIRDQIARTWGSADGLSYLNNLLRDSRDGERRGFTLGIVRELLFLMGLLEKRLEV